MLRKEPTRAFELEQPASSSSIEVSKDLFDSVLRLMRSQILSPKEVDRVVSYLHDHEAYRESCIWCLVQVTESTTCVDCRNKISGGDAVLVEITSKGVSNKYLHNYTCSKRGQEETMKVIARSYLGKELGEAALAVMYLNGIGSMLEFLEEVA